MKKLKKEGIAGEKTDERTEESTNKSIISSG